MAILEGLPQNFTYVGTQQTIWLHLHKITNQIEIDYRVLVMCCYVVVSEHSRTQIEIHTKYLCQLRSQHEKRRKFSVKCIKQCVFCNVTIWRLSVAN